MKACTQEAVYIWFINTQRNQTKKENMNLHVVRERD